VLFFTAKLFPLINPVVWWGESCYTCEQTRRVVEVLHLCLPTLLLHVRPCKKKNRKKGISFQNNSVNLLPGASHGSAVLDARAVSIVADWAVRDPRGPRRHHAIPSHARVSHRLTDQSCTVLIRRRRSGVSPPPPTHRHPASSLQGVSLCTR